MKPSKTPLLDRSFHISCLRYWQCQFCDASTDAHKLVRKITHPPIWRLKRGSNASSYEPRRVRGSTFAAGTEIVLMMPDAASTRSIDHRPPTGQTERRIRGGSK
jgi:hypothetical protein